MELPDARSEADRILSAGFEESARVQTGVRPPAVSREWGIPATCAATPAAHGLPSVPAADILLRLGAAFQTAEGPGCTGREGWSGYVNMAPALAHLRPVRPPCRPDSGKPPTSRRRPCGNQREGAARATDRDPVAFGKPDSMWSMPIGGFE
ncbi:hypothetical protein RKD27_002839 [Streptomyces sp. SAI-126]